MSKDMAQARYATHPASDSAITPLPWEVEPNAGRGAWIGNSGRWSALACGETHEEAAANAAFIVKAVNCHDDLVKALEAAQEHIGVVRLQRGFDVRPIQEQVAAVLNRAKEG